MMRMCHYLWDPVIKEFWKKEEKQADMVDSHLYCHLSQYQVLVMAVVVSSGSSGLSWGEKKKSKKANFDKWFNFKIIQSLNMLLSTTRHGKTEVTLDSFHGPNNQLIK